MSDSLAEHVCMQYTQDGFCTECGLLPVDGNPAPGLPVIQCPNCGYGVRLPKGATFQPCDGTLALESQSSQGLNDPSTQTEQRITPLRQDGPTLAQWIAAGYSEESYPPAGYAPVSDFTEQRITPLPDLADK